MVIYSSPTSLNTKFNRYYQQSKMQWSSTKSQEVSRTLYFCRRNQLSYSKINQAFQSGTEKYQHKACNTQIYTVWKGWLYQLKKLQNIKTKPLMLQKQVVHAYYKNRTTYLYQIHILETQSCSLHCPTDGRNRTYVRIRFAYRKKHCLIYLCVKVLP